MSTPTPTSDDPVAAPETAVPVATTGAAGSRTLVRVLWVLGIVTIALIVVFGVVYYFGQHADSGPSLADRDVTAAEQAVRNDQNNVGARLALAAAYLQAQRTEEALAQYVEITKAEPDNRTALLGSGTIRFENQDFTGAKADFQHIVDVSGDAEFSAADPQLERAMYYLGDSNLRLGDLPGAVKALESALAIDKTDADAWFWLGGAQVRAGDYQAASDSYQKALTFVPTGWCDPYEGLGVAYGHLNNADGNTYAKAMAAICAGNPEEGVPALESLTKGDFHVPALLGLGFASESSGDKAKAVDWFRQVIAADPSNIPALTALARLGANESASAKPSATPQPSASAS
jgi:tetratricopeptide (TPR) repeat protein